MRCSTEEGSAYLPCPVGLDHVYDTVEELDNAAMVHMHLNSQGDNDGIILGGPGKYDIDDGVRINGMNIAIAGLIQVAARPPALHGVRAPPV
jgi:hypothetical protein